MFLVAALPMAAQQGRGTILGTVTDSSGAAVPGAAVVMLNIGTNIVLHSKTNGEGFYTMPGVSVGEYSVSVEHIGFKKSVRTSIALQVDQKAQVDLVLQVGAVSEAVEVTAEIPLVDTGSATVGKVVEH